jgi:hypothetical protein
MLQPGRSTMANITRTIQQVEAEEVDKHLVDLTELRLQLQEAEYELFCLGRGGRKHAKWVLDVGGRGS